MIWLNIAITRCHFCHLERGHVISNSPIHLLEEPLPSHHLFASRVFSASSSHATAKMVRPVISFSRSSASVFMGLVMAIVRRPWSRPTGAQRSSSASVCGIRCFKRLGSCDGSCMKGMPWLLLSCEGLLMDGISRAGAVLARDVMLRNCTLRAGRSMSFRTISPL